MGKPKGSNKKSKGKSKSKPRPEAASQDGSAAMAVDGEASTSQGAPTTPAVWRAGQDPIAEDEAMDYDPTAYDCFHHFGIQWPCLSFDLLPDKLGGPRSTFPHTLYAVAGTQAAVVNQNTVTLMKVASLRQGRHGKKRDSRAPKPANSGDDSEDGASSEEDEDEDEDEDGPAAGPPPKFHYRSAAHKGGVNRIRAMPGHPGVCAVWGEAGAVSVWDLTSQLRELEGEAEPRMISKNKPLAVQPRFSHAASIEGYALGWSAAAPGRLAAGDCHAGLRCWDPAEGGTWQATGEYSGHAESVEDVQWSPTEATVLASCSVDGTVKIWDTRTRDRAMVSVRAHATDVNVLSWNALTTYMLASGGDDGTLRVWDLRSLSDESFVGHFSYHTKAVTSVEWCPQESSMLATASEDNQIVVWDLALERDPEEEAAAGGQNAELAEDVPPQVLFVHLGMDNPKEVHWHTQIPGMLVATGASGLQAFKPENLSL